MNHLNMLRSALAAAAMLGFAASASAAIAVGPTLPSATYTFNGNCTDCAQVAETEAYPVSGSLVLQGYTPGIAINGGNLFSFSYNPTNLFPGVTITNASDNWTLSGGVFSAQLNTPFEAALTLTGQYMDGENPVSFIFQTFSNGDYALCVNLPQGGESEEGGGQCNAQVSADFGTYSWSMTSFTPAPVNVPEPGSLALMALGLLGLGAANSRRRKSV